MPHAVFTSLLPAAMMAAGGISMSDGRAVDAFVAQVYAPYHAGDGARLQAWWDRAIYTSLTRQMIETWEAGGEHGDVSKPDRLCNCRDWDAADFRVDVVTRIFTGPGRAVVLLRVWPKARHSSDVRLSLVREGSIWKIEDVGDAASGKSLKVALQRAAG
jgi:hypothetical protein